MATNQATEMERLKDSFNPNAKHWRDLYSDYSKANSEALKAAVGLSTTSPNDTTNLGKPDILKVYAKYMTTVNTLVGLGHDPSKSYRNIITEGEAEGFLRRIANERHMEYEDYINQLSSVGLEEAMHVYWQTRRNGDVQGLTGGLVAQVLDMSNEMVVNSLTKQLRSENKMLAMKPEWQIKRGLEGYVTDWMNQYQTQTAIKTRPLTPSSN